MQSVGHKVQDPVAEAGGDSNRFEMGLAAIMVLTAEIKQINRSNIKIYVVFVLQR